ncbi:MAG: hypothetical protein K6E61_00315 [Bacteroidales bacterium]|nr:hypothetical protein [Bacteroidales bacterium]
MLKYMSILTLFGLIACGSLSRTPRVAGQPTLVDSVWVFSQSRPEGFTIDIRSWQEPKQGISVAYAETQNRHDREDLEYVISHAKAHEGYIGGWLNSEDGLYYFDSVRIFPENSIAQATEFGRLNGQDAVYVLSKGKEIRLMDEPQDVSPNTLIIMYDPEVGKEPLLAAVKEYGADLMYDYSIIPGIAIKIPDGKDIHDAIAFFKKVKGVTSVERDHIYHPIDPVKPKLEIM